METTPISMRLTEGDKAMLETIRVVTGLSGRTEVVRFLAKAYLRGAGLTEKNSKKKKKGVLTA